MRVLSPEQIAAGLADRSALLTGGPRDAPARQQAVQASIRWSEELLDEVTRLVWARLAVFAGGFDLGAARVVATGSGIEVGRALDLVPRWWTGRCCRWSMIGTGEHGPWLLP